MEKLVKTFTSYLQTVSPAKRRMMVLAALFFVVIVISVMAMVLGKSVNPEKKVRASARSVEFYPLTGKDTTKLQGDVTASRLREVESELAKIKSGDIVPGQSNSSAVNPVYPNGVPQKSADPLSGVTLSKEINSGDMLPGQIFAPGIVPPPVRKKTEQADNSINAVAPSTPKDTLFPAVGDKGGKNPVKPPVNKFEAPAQTSPSTETSVGGDNYDGMQPPTPPSKKMEIRELSEDEGAKSGEKGILGGAFSSAKANIQEQGLFMPSGSIISGVLITGMDAPTANQSRKDPFPVLLRVKEETLLPNRMKMDIRECFIIASGYGDMSTERAFIRAETVSCVREDGGVVESAMNAYAVGEDGKNGVRGKLVSKTGQLVAKSLMAGFLAGTADALKPQRAQTLQIAQPGQSQSAFTNVDPEQVFSSGALGGVNTAMNKIADYYIEMAKSIFPIVEIDAGRKIDFIMIRGAKLAIQSSSKGATRQENGRSGSGSTREVYKRQSF